MAKPVKLGKNKEFEFRSSGGGVSKYPWSEWLNGSLLLLERSTDTETKDFTVEVDAMIPKIKTAARRRYKVVQVSRLDAEGNKLVDSLIIKARDMDADERVTEDIKRAEEKESRANSTAGEPVPVGNGEA